MSAAQPNISIVVPVYNERDNLETLYTEMTEAMESFGQPYEIIAVDDGSKDGSLELLRAISARDPRLRVVRLARNFGQTPALYAGFEHARGEYVVTIDADLQNPPSEIPILLRKLQEGEDDVVQGWRQQREDSLLRKSCSRLVNLFVTRATGFKVNDLGTGLKAYRRELVEQLCLARHRARYIPAETAWLGARVSEVKVKHRNRGAGESKYSMFHLLRVNFDLVTSISAAPVQVMGLVGFIFAIIGLLTAVRVLYVRFAHGDINQLTTVVALFLVLAGVQILCTSVLCAYISRIFQEVQQRPYYILGEESAAEAGPDPERPDA